MALPPLPQAMSFPPFCRDAVRVSPACPMTSSRFASERMTLALLFRYSRKLLIALYYTLVNGDAKCGVGNGGLLGVRGIMGHFEGFIC